MAMQANPEIIYVWPSVAIQPFSLTRYPARPANDRNQPFGHSILGFVLQPAFGRFDSVRLSEASWDSRNDKDDA